jgi:hypothetical protein
MKVSQRVADLRPTPNNWFASTLVYEGHGVLDFTNPLGRFEGPARIVVDEEGRCTADFHVVTVSPEMENFVYLMAFLDGVDLPKAEKGKPVVHKSGGTSNNNCSAFKVTSDAGVFTATKGISYSYSVGQELTLRLRWIGSQFDPAVSSQARFWVLPISNFISEFAERDPDLDRHPLRIYPTPELPPDLTVEERSLAPFVINSKNRLIIFSFASAKAYIEALPDYEEIKFNLQSRKRRNQVTALMIGEVGSCDIECATCQSWIPFEYLQLLAVATGSAAGSPWIEFRDASGMLVRRCHVSLRPPTYAHGHSVISEAIHRGTGELISAYSASDVLGKTYLLTALNNLVEAQMEGDLEEMNFRSIIIAFETLCNEFGFGTQHLHRYLTDASWDFVKTALQHAASEIQNRIATLDRVSNHTEVGALDEIAKRTLHTPVGKTRAFGLSMVDLLKYFKLPDAQILDSHFAVNPRRDGLLTWSQVLTTYRGTLMHVGYFREGRSSEDFLDLYRIRRHLHDVFLRIFFSLVKYRGTYQPPVKIMTTQCAVDWVKPSTTARELGF